MTEKVQKIMVLVAEICPPDKEPHDRKPDIFLRYSPRLKYVELSIYEDGWNATLNPNYFCIRFESDGAEKQLDEIIKRLEKLKERN